MTAATPEKESPLLAKFAGNGSPGRASWKGRLSRIMTVLWTVVGAAVGLLIGAGLNVLGYSPPEFRLARTCFWASATLMGITDIAWHLQTDWPPVPQLCVAFSIWVGITVGLPAGLRWIDRREASYASTLPPKANAIVLRLFDASGKEVVNDRTHHSPSRRGRNWLCRYDHCYCDYFPYYRRQAALLHDATFDSVLGTGMALSSAASSCVRTHSTIRATTIRR